MRKSENLTVPRTIIREMRVKCKKRLHARKDCMMEAVKLNNDMAKSSPSAAGFFYRRIGGTLFKVRVYTGSGYADTLDEKIPRLILNEMVTGAENYVKMDSPQMSQPPERSSE